MDLHATHAQKRNQSQFSPSLHLQAPDKEDRKKRKREIGNDSKDAVHESERDDNVGIETLAILIAVPEVRDGVTLEESDEEEDDASKNGEGHGDVDGPNVGSLHDNSKEENGD